MKLRINRLISSLLMFIMVILLVFNSYVPIASGGTVSVPKPKLRVLEVQPGERYQLASTSFGNNYEVVLVQMPIDKFISTIEDLNGRYDIIFIGNNTYTENVSNLHYLVNSVRINSSGSNITKLTVQYNAAGNRYNRMNGSSFKLPQDDGGSDSREQYSPNDITDRRAKVVKEFIESGQLTIFADSIFNSSMAETKLYKNFVQYKNNPAFSHFKLLNSVNTEQLKANSYQAAQKRPTLEVSVKPTEYTGSANSYQDNRIMGFNFKVYNNNAASMTTKLYLDTNSNGIFSPNEVVTSTGDIVQGDGYVLNYRVPDSYVGLHSWKLELTDLRSGAKNYQQGFTAFKGTPLKIRVLQLTPPGNTLSLADSLRQPLEQSDEYKIVVTQMTVNEFNNNYPNLVNGKPTLLNTNYDMLIVGFADIYGGADIKNPAAVQAIKDFITTGQSVMFTHDTNTFLVRDPNGWAYNLTKEFRDLIGQNIYIKDAMNPERAPAHDKKLPWPDSVKKSYGFSRLTLDRANNGGSFPTANNAYKLNDGAITRYPYVLDDILPVATTHHQYYQLDLEDEDVIPWFTLYGNGFNSGDGRNNYYTYSKGNITYSGTGHTKPDYTEEHKFFVNTMIKASRGANHAPVVEIYNLAEGQSVPKSWDSLAFSFKATDLDIPEDNNLHAEFYLEYSGKAHRIMRFTANDKAVSAGDLVIENGKIVNISLPNTVPTDVDYFNMKVVVRDNSKAEAVRSVNLNYIELPTISVSAGSDAGYLSNDEATMAFIVQPENIQPELNLMIEDIQLVIVPPDNPGAYKLHADRLTEDLPDLNVNHGVTSWASQERKIGLALLKAVDPLTFKYYLKYTLNYSGAKETVHTQPQSLALHVKTGEIYGEVKDNKGRGISDILVTVKDQASASTWDIRTSNTGSYSLSGLKSGDYEIAISPPEGFFVERELSRKVKLSFDKNAEEANFILSGDLVANVDITNKFNSDPKNVHTVKNGIIYGKITFSLQRTTESMKIVLSNKNIADQTPAHFVFKPINILKDGNLYGQNFTVNGLDLQLPANLPPSDDEYVLTVAIYVRQDAAPSADYQIKIESITTKEPNIKELEIFEPLCTPLIIHVKDWPRIM